MNTSSNRKELNQSTLRKQDHAIYNHEMVDDLSELDELETWSVDEMQDVLDSASNHIPGEFDYAWNDAFFDDQILTFMD